MKYLSILFYVITILSLIIGILIIDLESSRILLALPAGFGGGMAFFELLKLVGTPNGNTITSYYLQLPCT